MSKYLKNDAVKQVARNLIMNAAQREKAKAGRVTMPKVFFVIGIIGFVLLATAFCLFCYITDNILRFVAKT